MNETMRDMSKKRHYHIVTKLFIKKPYHKNAARPSQKLKHSYFETITFSTNVSFGVIIWTK